MLKYTKPLKKDMTDGTTTIKAGTDVYFIGFIDKDGNTGIRCHSDKETSILVPDHLNFDEYVDTEKIPEWLEKNLKKKK